MKTYGPVEAQLHASLISALDETNKQLHDLGGFNSAPPPPPVPTEHEAGYAPEAFWKLQRRRKSLALLPVPGIKQRKQQEKNTARRKTHMRTGRTIH
jgi:hypothetical protein